MSPGGILSVSIFISIQFFVTSLQACGVPYRAHGAKSHFFYTSSKVLPGGLFAGKSLKGIGPGIDLRRLIH
jgi:hypothetical protein